MRVLALAALLSLAGYAAAHGYVPFIKINGEVIPGWDVQSDPYTTPQPLRVVRATKPDSGFIADPTSGDITCSIGNSHLPPGPIQAEVEAGGTVSMMWNTWPTGHYGPILNYMAKCATDDCSPYKGDTGSPWFKIQQDAFENGVWASDVLATTNNFTYDVHIPKNIQPGAYLLRHENLALHGASNVGGAQFYPVCVQLTVTGGGSLAPSGLSFPGAYSASTLIVSDRTQLAQIDQAEDPGIHFNPYQGDAANEAYIPPGGDVYPGLQF